MPRPQPDGLPPGVEIVPLPMVCRSGDKARGFRGFLAEQYHEERRATGLGDAGVFELWGGPEGTWTVFLEAPDGTICYIASGLNLEPRPGVRS